MNSNAAGFVGDIPTHYDRSLGPVIFIDYAADITKRTIALRPARVLEIAAGTGIVTRALRDALPASTQLIATDLNPPMLEVARRKFRCDERVTFDTADATSLPFADESFDAALCQFGIMFFPDKAKSFREIHRVLAPGGHYLFSVWDSHRHNPFGRIGHETAGKFFPTDPPQFYVAPFSYHQIDSIKESLIETGFTDINVAVIKLQKEIGDATGFAQALVYGNPLIDEIRARGGADPDRVVDAMLRAVRHEFGAVLWMPLQAIVFSAMRP